MQQANSLFAKKKKKGNEEGQKGVCGLVPLGPKKRMTRQNNRGRKKKFWAGWGFPNEIWPMKSFYLL